MYSSRNMVVITELDEVSFLLSKFSMTAVYQSSFVFFLLFLLLFLWLPPALDFDVTFSEFLELFLSCMYSLFISRGVCKIHFSVIDIKSSKLYKYQSKAKWQQADSTNSHYANRHHAQKAFQKGITLKGIALKSITWKIKHHTKRHHTEWQHALRCHAEGHNMKRHYT